MYFLRSKVMSTTAPAGTEAEEVRKWTGLGVVDTIYEDDDDGDGDGDTSTTLSISPELRSPSSTTSVLHSRILAWSMARGVEADVVIHIQNSSFCLHKEALASRSGYLRRNLKGVNELIVSPPLKITAETFTLVAEFCYGAHIAVTPFNVASLRVAAELLEMTEANGALDENLRQKTEVYFRRAVAVNRDHASVVLRTSLALLPEAETAASLVSWCADALTLTDDVDGVMRCFGDVKDLRPREFVMIVESMSQRLTGSHDLLYKLVDFYLKEYSGKIRDEEKSRMCNYIDCTSLSPERLMHAVRNPRMPLRFVVQAMFVEQLNTRRSIVSAASDHHRENKQKLSSSSSSSAVTTLGSILQHDAAIREVEQLKAAMDATSSRIQTLESQLSGMKKLLHDDDDDDDDKRMISANKIESGSAQSVSFRFSSEDERKVKRGQIGSVSSVSFRVLNLGTSASSSSSEKKRFSGRFLSGLRNAFRAPTFFFQEQI